MADASGRPRAPAIVNGLAALALFAMVLGFALTVDQPPPPTIAEFAPQAQETIEEAPPEQSSEFGTTDIGDTGTGPGIGPPVPPPPPEPPVIDVSRVRRCVGDPPRQTEDPQSPPCIPFWEGDNGGATARGVTGNEIRFWVPVNEGGYDVHQQLAAYFNSRFEFYGRKMTVSYGPGGTASPDGQRAHAAEAEKANVFATGAYRNGTGFYYGEDAARRKIISVQSYFSSETGYLERRAPYLWQYAMATDNLFSSMGDWACSRLAGDKAVHAVDDDIELTAKRRAFGIIVQPWFQDDPADPAPLVRALRTCDEEPTLVLRSPVGGTGDYEFIATDPTTANTAMLRMKESGATSVICMCNYFSYGALAKAASNQRYHPEWLASTYGGLDVHGTMRYGAPPEDQIENLFGITVQPRQVSPSDEPVFQALKDVEPSTNRNWDFSSSFLYINQYRYMLLLASGIQMAGPNLSPQTFSNALRTTAFPNPPDHPLRAGNVGFAHGPAMTIDGAEYWWDNEATSPYEDQPAVPGTYCYVGGGTRHARGSWPEGGDPFFSGSCP